jgi:predicted RNA-binding Zn-ribbon protein involved in translation (DUF1610 family)
LAARSEEDGLVGIITQIGRAPGVRRLVRKPAAPAEVRESPDDEDRDPRWCASCRREVLFEMTRCPQCGGEPVTGTELARRDGSLPPPPGAGPTSW